MSVYKDNATGKWRVIYRYTDITGKRKQTQKRGFETKREAVAWEHEMMLKSQAKLDMTFGSFYEIYEADKASRLKRSTWETKSHIIRTKILPYFADRKIDEIEVRDVIAWQNELLAAFKDEGKEEKYSQDYLRTIQAQLTAIFAHAVKYYNLPKNPYILRRLLNREVVVQGNPKVFKALKHQMTQIYEELKRLEKVSNDNEELIIVVEMIATIMKGMVNEYDG